VYLGGRERKKTQGCRQLHRALEKYDYDKWMGGTCSMLATHQKQICSEYSSWKNYENKDIDGKAKLSLA
jgi:hypothetical protein